MTAATFTNFLPLAGILALVALFGVLALVDAWRSLRQQRRHRRTLRGLKP